MGGLWHFIREREGVISKLSVPKYSQWWDGRIGLPHEDGYVHTCEIIVDTENRKPIAIWQLERRRERVDSKGYRLEKGISWDFAEALAIAQMGEHKPKNMPDGSIDARGAFRLRKIQAKRQWKPSKVDEEALAEAINIRAGWNIIGKWKSRR